jgi:hypothetical protein
MKIFLPDNILVLFISGLLLFFLLIAGFFIMKKKSYRQAIVLAWLILFFATLSLEKLCSSEPPGFRMLVIIFAMLFSMKIIVSVESYKGAENRLSLIQWLAFATGWFGMRPRIFESLGAPALTGSRALIFSGILRLGIGFLFLVLAKWTALNYNSYFSDLLITILLLAGISLMLHFGILNVSAGLWRLMGVDSKALFKAPLLSSSLSEFWGKRWNIAFSEMTALAIYRPLKDKTGIPMAMLLAFLFSGLLHEMAISVPVKAGYGLPLLYFFIHGVVMLLERQMQLRGCPVDRHKWLGRIWVICWILIPVSLLFHKAFIEEIIRPVIGL